MTNTGLRGAATLGSSINPAQSVGSSTNTGNPVRTASGLSRGQPNWSTVKLSLDTVRTAWWFGVSLPRRSEGLTRIGKRGKDVLRARSLDNQLSARQGQPARDLRERDHTPPPAARYRG